MQLPCLNAWVGIFMKYHSEKEAWLGHLQNLYAETDERLLLLGMEHFTGNVCAFM